MPAQMVRCPYVIRTGECGERLTPCMGADGHPGEHASYAPPILGTWFVPLADSEPDDPTEPGKRDA